MNYQPHPNDKSAQIRLLKKKVRQANSRVPNSIVLDAMARAALEKAHQRIEELEQEVQQLKECFT